MSVQLGKPAPDARIVKMREYEEKNFALREHVKMCAQRDGMAAWENKTDKTIQQNQALARCALYPEVHNCLQARRTTGF